eukprot:927125_1
MNACVSVTNRSVVHKHVFVEVRCSTEDAIAIELSSHDWAADLDMIVKTIANSFKSLSNITWKMAANPPPTDVSLTSIVTPHKKRSPDINDMTNEILHDMSALNF